MQRWDSWGWGWVWRGEGCLPSRLAHLQRATAKFLALFPRVDLAGDFIVPDELRGEAEAEDGVRVPAWLTPDARVATENVPNLAEGVRETDGAALRLVMQGTPTNARARINGHEVAIPARQYVVEIPISTQWLVRGTNEIEIFSPRESFLVNVLSVMLEREGGSQSPWPAGQLEGAGER